MLDNRLSIAISKL